MESTERLFKGTVEELERLLQAKQVLADPIEKGDATIIPMVSYGFGFGAGAGDDSKRGSGGGSGAGGGIKPLGAIIIDKDGVRVEGFKGRMSGVFEAMAECCSHMMERMMDRKSGTETDKQKKKKTATDAS